MAKNKTKRVWYTPQQAAEASQGLLSRAQIVRSVQEAALQGDEAILKAGIHYQIIERAKYKIYKIDWQKFKKLI